MFSLLGDAVAVAYHVVSALTLVLAPLPGGLATAAAIVLFTIAVRLVLLPLSYYAIRGQVSQARLGSQVQKLRARHAGHPERLQREMGELGSPQAPDLDGTPLEPLAGPYARILFAIGLFGASMLAASVLPLSTAYAICGAFGWERGVSYSWGEAPV